MSDNERHSVESLISSAGRREQPTELQHQRAFERVQQVWTDSVRRQRRRAYVRWTAMAASLVVVTLATQYWWSRSVPLAEFARLAGAVQWRESADTPWRSAAIGGAVLQSGSEVLTLPGSGAALQLRSGHSLRLAGDTAVLLASAGNLQLQQGAVYVDSGLQIPTRMLSVATPVGEVAERGTQFEVRYQGAERSMQVRVREGRVQLSGSGLRENLGAGEQSQWVAGVSSGPLPLPPDDASWGWVAALAPAPEFNGQPFNVLIEWAARELGKRVSFATPAAAARAANSRLQGSAGALAPRQALDLLLPTAELRYSIEGGTIIIRMEDRLESSQ